CRKSRRASLPATRRGAPAPDWRLARRFSRRFPASGWVAGELGQDGGPFAGVFATKKPLPGREEVQSFWPCLLSSLQTPKLRESAFGRIWHLASALHGCWLPGFIGPVPPPLSIRAAPVWHRRCRRFFQLCSWPHYRASRGGVSTGFFMPCCVLAAAAAGPPHPAAPCSKLRAMT